MLFNVQDLPGIKPRQVKLLQEQGIMTAQALAMLAPGALSEVERLIKLESVFGMAVPKDLTIDEVKTWLQQKFSYEFREIGPKNNSPNTIAFFLLKLHNLFFYT